MSEVRGLDPKRFLERFFGDGNELDLEKPPKVARALRPWVQRVEEGKERILLPRKENGRVTWYALADSGRNARAFREELLAAVGPSYTDFSGAEASLSRSDPVEAAILDFTGTHAFRLSLVDPGLTEACRQALERMLELHDGRPPSQVRAPRIPGLILRDFEFALQQGDRELAGDAMEELRSGGYLDGQNMWFLDIRRKEAFHEWAAIRGEVEEGTILELRRPVRTTQALLRAVYRVDLLRFEDGVRASEAVVYFEQQLFGSIRGLLSSRERMTAPEVAKLFMLKAAATRDLRLRDSLLEGSSVRGADKVYLHAIADLVRNPEESRRVLRDEAVEAYMSGDTDRAFELVAMGGGGEWRMRLLLRCALELDSLRAAQIALNVIENSLPAERVALQNDSNLARQLRKLRERYTTPSVGVPTGWLNWLQMVSSDVLDDSKADELAQRGAEEWSLKELVARPNDVVKLANAMLEVRGPAKQQLRSALPYFQAFLMSDEEPTPTLKPVLRSLLIRYVLDDDARSVGTWRAATEVFGELVRCGVSDEEYAEAVNYLQILLEDRLPLAAMDEALDLLETLVTLTPGHSMTRRAAVLVHGELIRWREHLSRMHINLFNQLGRESGAEVLLPLPEVEPSETKHSGFGRLRGGVVALYSLNEGVLARVKSMLESNVEGIRVLTFNDKIGGQSMLLEAARTADVFVIATGAAKQSATEFIEANRGVGLVTLRTHGKGSASIIGVLESASQPTTSVNPMQKRLAHQIADLLAALEHDEGRARLLATRAGLRGQYLPKFETAAVFWNDVVDQAVRGRFRLSELVLRAAGEFPHNSEIAALARRLEEL